METGNSGNGSEGASTTANSGGDALSNAFSQQLGGTEFEISDDDDDFEIAESTDTGGEGAGAGAGEAATGAESGSASSAQAAEAGNSDTGKPNPAGGAEGGQPQQPDFNAFLVEQTGGAVKSADELKAILGRPDLSKYPEVQKLFEHYENRGSFDTFLQLKALGNVDELDNRAAIRKITQLENPSWDEGTLDLWMDKTYPADDGRYTEAELKYSNLLQEKEGYLAKQKLLEKQKELASSPKATETETKAAQALQEWTQIVNDPSSAIEQISFTVNEGDKAIPVNYVLSAEDKTSLNQAALNAYKQGDFWKQVGTDEKGNFSMQRMMRGMALAMNQDKAMAHFFAEGRTKGTETTLSTARNQKDFSDNAGSGGSSSVNSNSMGSAFLRSREQHQL